MLWEVPSGEFGGGFGIVTEFPIIRATSTDFAIIQPDVKLLLDAHGVIRDVTLASSFVREGVSAWVGQPWAETVDPSGAERLQQLIAEARAVGTAGFGQFLQRFPDGGAVAMEYTAVRLGKRSGLLAIGRSLQAVAEVQSRLIAAQKAMTQDYWQLRDIESRYRALFDVADEAVVILSAQDLRLIEANPAAQRAFALSPGQAFTSLIATADRSTFRAALAQVGKEQRMPGFIVHIGPQQVPWVVRATFAPAKAIPALVLHLVEISGAKPVPRHETKLPIEALIERLPDGFAVIDRSGTVRAANRAFFDFVQAGKEEQVIGAPLKRWLSEPGADAAMVLATLARQPALRLMPTTLHGEFGHNLPVEISAAGTKEQDSDYIAVLIRDVRRRLAQDDAHASTPPIAVPPQDGSLRKLVSETVARVERQQIVAALAHAGGNRSAAAAALKLSRQSLYAKLERYHIEDTPPAAAADTPPADSAR